MLKKTLLMTAICVGLSACGGGDTLPSAPKTDEKNPALIQIPASLVGIYDVDFGLFRAVYTLLDDGRFSGFHYTADYSIVSQPHTSYTPAFATTVLRPVSWAIFSAGFVESSVSFNRQLNNGVLNFDIASGGIGPFNANAKIQKTYNSNSSKTLYFDPISMSILAGNYLGEVRSVGIQTPTLAVNDFVLDNTGNFTVTSATCTFKGKLIQHGTTGIFNLQVQTTGDTCGYKGPLLGILTPLTLINDKPRLALQMATEDGSQATVFIIQKT